jgi:hypothetical protein
MYEDIHESLQEQAREVTEHCSMIEDEIMAGLDCDEIEEGQGAFGTLDNPIPVNGSIGEIKYLNKLRGLSGKPLFFHRLGSDRSSICKKPIDIYEVVCIDGTQWNKLCFDLYHPRRSNRVPENYRLTTLAEDSDDLHSNYIYGVNIHLKNFPFDLSEIIFDIYGEENGWIITALLIAFDADSKLG